MSFGPATMTDRAGHGEVRLVIAVQRRLADRRAAVQTARALSTWGEHAAGWLAVSGLAAAVGATAYRPAWGRTAMAAFAAHAAAVVVKRVVRRARPHDPRVQVLVGTPSRLSFPSAHAASTSAFLLTAPGLPVTARVAGVAGMGVSRVLLGVHYPSDVAAGAGLGVLAHVGARAWRGR